ncbi:MaoC family dehydratase [Spongiactinospora sp. TRM90649]|uniref:MaoC family dehydratase n=1 Tax=Spongiactinospora sp. TRM90649 TaxID=3031114 RepID=UPI0023F6199D|nr:MaoC family dehydratase [Spongiactinospora sp. TRM90649]MDF5753454.1 MaoC family dehydratase [Spongiactinospora sp. TRM90649]
MTTSSTGVPRRFGGIDSLRSHVGEELGVSEWFEVDQDRVDAFAEITEDRQWIHVDPARAASGPYRAPIAHGYLTLSLIPVLGSRIFTVDGVRMSINYGLNKVRFPQAVTVGSRIRSRATLVSVDDTAAGTQAVIRHTIEIDGQDKPACIAETVRLLVPRGAPDPGRPVPGGGRDPSSR